MVHLQNFSKFLLLFASLFFSKLALAQNLHPLDFNGAERDALLALKAEFNLPFLNKNWTSIMCYMNNTPAWYGIQCLNGRVTGLVLEGLGLTGVVKVDALFNLPQLSVLSFKNNSISGTMMDFSQTLSLRQLDLSSNNFDGPISDSLLRLDFLESLQLQDNNFTGSIPALNQSSLTQFNVSNNQLSGPIPNTKTLQSFNYSSSYSGDDNLCGPPSSTPCVSNYSSPPNNDGDDSHSHLSKILIVADVIGVLVIIALIVLYCKKSRKFKNMKKNNNIEDVEVDKEGVLKQGNVNEDSVTKIDVEENEMSEAEESGKLMFLDNGARFELNDLLRASAEGLGKGNFGSCYKATLDDGSAIVVHRLRDLRQLSSTEFARQVQVIADQKHPNLLPLLAYYYSRHEKLLLYKFAANGNLYNRLHGGRDTKDRIPFRWSSRLSVARAVARALEYLHLNSTTTTTTTLLPTAPHGNLKSSNILLDSNQTVLVSGYSLAPLLGPPVAAQRIVSYKSPEYQTYKTLSAKSDVWSYGCLLLELLTGKVPAFTGANGVDLCKWVDLAVREEWTAEIFDVEMTVHGHGGGANQGMLRLLQVAMQCCERTPDKRPEMSEVVKEVENIKVIESGEDDDELSFDPSFTDDSISEPSSHVA